MKQLSPPHKYIITREDTPLMAGDEQARTVPLGTVIKATHSQGNWFYDPEQEGWLHRNDMVPVEEAIKQFQQEVGGKPTARSYQLLGIAQMCQDQWASAAQSFEKAYDLGESSVALHLNLGTCYERLEEPVAALQEYDTILKTYPDDVSALQARGNLLLLQGQYRAALRDLEMAARLLPQSADAQNSYGVALRMIGRYEDAINAYSRALEIDAERADALGNRGYAKKCLGNYIDALKDYEAAVKLAPRSNAIRNDLAWLLATVPDPALRDGPRAVSISEAVCADTSNRNGEYLDTLAAAYASVGRFTAAVEAARLAISTMKEHPGVVRVRERLKLYEQDRPFLESPATATETPPEENPAE